MGPDTILSILGAKFWHAQYLPLLGPHSLGDDRIVEQGVPALLDFSEGEAAAELHTQVDSCQVIGL